jgi:hypothetical protein
LTTIKLCFDFSDTNCVARKTKDPFHFGT